MAFEKNQQDQFNMNNNIDQVKQFQAELDKATESIGTAELEAEEELLSAKRRNLTTTQKIRLRQLNQLIALEENSIQELAKLKNTLSARQFEARKKEIQREFKLARETAEALSKLDNPKRSSSNKPTQKNSKKPNPIIKDIASTATVKPTTGAKAPNTSDTKSALLEINKLLHSVDSTLTNIQNAVSTIRGQVNKDLQELTNSQLPVPQAEQSTSQIEQSKLLPADVNIEVDPTKLLPPTTQSVNVEPELAIEPTPVTVTPNIIVEPQIIIEPAPTVPEAPPKNKPEPTPIIIEDFIISDAFDAANYNPNLPAQAETQTLAEIQPPAQDFTQDLVQVTAGLASELVNTASTIQLTNNLLAQLTNSKQEQRSTESSTANGGTSNRLSESNSEQSTKNLVESEGNTGGTNNNNGQEIPAPENRGYSNNTNGMESVDLGKYEFDSVINTFDSLKDYIENDLNAITAIDLATVIGSKGTDHQASQTTVDFTGDLLNGILAANEAEAELQKFKSDSAEAELNKRLYIATEEQKLRTKHAKDEADLVKKGLAEQAKARDLALNADAYAREAQLALENELAAKRNKLTEDLIKKEEALKFTTANRAELLDLQRRERENKYLEEYNEHLLAAGEYAVSLEEYKADQEKKRNTKAKKEAVDGITSGLKQFGTGNFSMTDIKKSYGDYMGQRTADLSNSYMEDFKKNNPDATEEELAEAQRQADASAKLTANFELLAAASGDLMDALDGTVRKMADVQGFVDTRLQGSRDNDQKGLSYWKQLLSDAKSIAGASPFMKQEKLVENIKALVDKGISFDIKQRAFLMTVQEKIANTFNVADGTLLRLIRIQQQDTTAGRLGMESALNSFLNSMYETSEYLESVAVQVRSSLEEMQALMDGKDAVELEYQVQKWMGSLYSVGMSDSAVQDIAKTFGQIASGDISGLIGSGTGNLLIMAANEAGMSIADILQDGLNAEDTNKLMQAMVNYLAEIAESSNDSRVVQQQLAGVYGMKASDLKAATNLSSSVKDVAKSDKSYFDMMLRLNTMMNTIRFRTSMAEGMTNMWDNVMYSMASTQASNPILYALPKMAKLLKDVTGGEGGGGIALPFLNVYGFGVDLNTTVSDLMMVASMAGTALGALGPLVTGVADLVNPLAGTTMMMRAGINPLDGALRALTRGSAEDASLQNTSGASTSESGSLVANGSGEDIKNATMQDAEDDKKKQMVEAKDEESADDVAAQAQQAVVDIFQLLEEVAHGSQSLRVRVVNGSGFGGGSSYGGENGEGTGSGVPSTDNGNWLLTF